MALFGTMLKVGGGWYQPSIIVSIEKANASFKRKDGISVIWIITLDRCRLGMKDDISNRRWVSDEEVKPLLEHFGIDPSTVNTTPETYPEQDKDF